MVNKQMESINKINHNLISLILFIGFCFSTAVHASETLQVSSTTADSMHFHVSYTSKVEPLPLNRIHSWKLHIESLDGKAVENAEISVHGGMPAHKHGLPTEPVVTEIGTGDYLVEGIKFSMNGKWELWFNIRAGEITEKVKFNVEL